MNTIDVMKLALEELKQSKSLDDNNRGRYAAIASLERAIKQEEEARLEARMLVEPYAVTWSGVVFKHDR